MADEWCNYFILRDAGWIMPGVWPDPDKIMAARQASGNLMTKLSQLCDGLVKT